jgi:hypothetical protein
VLPIEGVEGAKRVAMSTPLRIGEAEMVVVISGISYREGMRLHRRRCGPSGRSVGAMDRSLIHHGPEATRWPGLV